MQPLCQECVVSEISMVGVRGQTEKNQHGFFKRVAGLYGDIERGIVTASLRAAHPVENAFRFRV